MNKIDVPDAPKLIEHYTKLYENQEADFRNSNLRKVVLKHAIGNTALEVGCGTGHLALDLLKRGIWVTAIDISPEMVEFAKKTTGAYANQVQILNLKAEELDKLGAQTFDLITCIDVLEHVRFDLEVLIQMRERLSKQGQLVLVVPAHPWLYGLRDSDMGHFRRYSRRELLQKMTQCGFVVKKLRFWNITGILPYFVSEKLLKRPVNESIRHATKSPLARTLNALLSSWFSLFENHCHMGFGLSLFIVAEKSKAVN